MTVQRAYADWRRFPQYIASLSEASIDLIFAPAYGSTKKNATDIRLAIDALEIGTPPQEVAGAVMMSGFSRLPVYEGDLDNILALEQTIASSFAGTTCRPP